MSRLNRDRAMAAGLILLSFVVALCQRPGRATSDTKIDLHVDPVAFVGQVASVWNHSIDLGAVQSAQYGGYLWPMGPFFAAMEKIDIGSWVASRLWVGMLFALSAWGVLRLMDLFVGRPRGIAHLVAATFYVLNPYTVIFTARTSVVFLGYAALPWLLLVIHHGVQGVSRWRDWRGWWWAAVFALILTSVGGGINGAVVGWMLVGPLVMLIYEPLIGSVRWRDSASFLVRMGVLGILASLWWIVPLSLHSKYGIDFLQFTEQPRTIWGTNSIPEALRLMAYWTSYIGVGFFGANRPLFSEAGTLLFNPWVVGASLILPALALASFAAGRRYRYAPFLLLVLIVGMVIEAAGFPAGTPARGGMEWVYRNVPLVRFMRTTQKAAPLVAIGVAGLLGIGTKMAWARLQELRPGALRTAGLMAMPLALAGLIALAALPLVRGTAVERQLTWDRIPAAWTDVGADLDDQLPRSGRAMVLPGQIFANYTWGGTIDAILPRVTDRPVAVRYETPYSDPHAFDLLSTVDGLVQQRRLLPGQLMPLLKLMGVRAVVTGSDDDISRSGAVDAESAAVELEGQGLGRPSRSYGPVRAFPPAVGEIGDGRRLPQVRRYDIPAGRGLVDVAPTDPATIVDGGAGGLAALAAFGALPDRAPILYAGDLHRDQLRAYAARGANVVVSDSNRRRRFLPEFSQQSLGRTLAQNEPLNENFAQIDPFPDRGSDSQTVAALRGAAYLRSPDEGGLLTFPEHAAISAFDGDPSTTWTANRYLRPEKRWIEIGFTRPRDVPWVELQPIRDWRGIEKEVSINGVRAKLGPGVTRVPVDLKDARAVRVTITKVDQPPGNLRGSGGFREIRIPGVHVRQSLRTPLLTARALAGRDLGHTALSYVFERTTGDQPFLRDRQTGSPLLQLGRNREDSERRIDRAVFAPAARSYDLGAWVHPAVDAPDSVLDRLAGMGPAGGTFDSSGRFHNQPRYRASSAFDARPDSNWIGIWAPPSAEFPWLSFTSPRPLRVSRLRLAEPSLAVRRPSRVRVSWDGGTTPSLAVGADGTVELPRPVTARGFRLTVLATQFPDGVSARERKTRAVGISSVEVPGLEKADPPVSGPLRAACGSVRIRVGAAGRSGARASAGRAPDQSIARLEPRGTVEQLNAGRPFRARGCDGPVRMGEGLQLIDSLPGPLATDMLRMSSPAPEGLPPVTGGGRVLDPGDLGNDTLKNVQVALDGPSWLVMGQSFSKGWEATCDGRSLGESVPVNAYANGWRAPADCRDVAFEFTPQSTARRAYLVSALVCLALLAFVIGGWLRTRRHPSGEPDRALLPDWQPRRLPLYQAAAIALALSVPLGLMFALRTSLATFPLLTLILWRGAGPRLLAGAAAVLFGIVTPLIYLISSPEDRGGFDFEYSLQVIYAHWLGVGGLVLLMAACWRALAAAHGRRGDTPPSEPRIAVPSAPLGGEQAPLPPR